MMNIYKQARIVLLAMVVVCLGGKGLYAQQLQEPHPIQKQNIQNLFATSSKYLSQVLVTSQLNLADQNRFAALTKPVTLNTIPYTVFFSKQLFTYYPDASQEDFISFTFVVFQPPDKIKMQFLQELAKPKEEQNVSLIKKYSLGFTPGLKEFDDLRQTLAQSLARIVWKEKNYQFGFLVACPTKSYDISLVFFELQSLSKVRAKVETSDKEIEFHPGLRYMTASAEPQADAGVIQETKDATIRVRGAKTPTRILSQKDVTIKEGRILSLSPNSQWLLVAKNNALCLYNTASLTEHVCSALPKGKPDYNTVTWSPDSRYVAFTEDSTRFFYDSDVWILEVATGKMQNVTDDNFTGAFSISKEKNVPDLITVDLAPAWLSNNQGLLFSRSTFSKNTRQGTALYRLPMNLQEPPEKLLTVNEKTTTVVWSNMYYVSKRHALLYVVNNSNQYDPQNGIWIVALDSPQAQQLSAFTKTKLGPAVLLDVSEQQELALLWYSTPNLPPPLKPLAFALMDLHTGNLTPVKQQKQGNQRVSPTMTNAVFSPDGSHILFTYQAESGKSLLAVRHLQDETEHVLLTYSGLLGGDLKNQWVNRWVLDWGVQDMVYVATGEASGLLLSLGTE